MGYSVNLNRLSVKAYKDHLLSIELLPSRRVLLDAIDRHFSAISDCGIDDIGAFMQAVSTPKKLSDLSRKASISEDYLKILKREIGGLLPKSIALSEFDMLTSDMLEELKSAGMRSSKDFYEAYSHSGVSGLTKEDCDRLFALCGLVRINGIGALAAKIFFEAGYVSAADIASADPQSMADKFNALNDEKHYYDGQRLGIKDMTFCIVHAKMLEQYS